MLVAALGAGEASLLIDDFDCVAKPLKHDAHMMGDAFVRWTGDQQDAVQVAGAEWAYSCARVFFQFPAAGVGAGFEAFI